MKSKGAVKFFAIALAVVCLFQLSFTLVGWIVENRADRFAGGDPVKRSAYLDSISREPVYNLGVKKYTFNEVKERELNLGLDLRGGMRVTMAVALDKLLLELSNNNDNETFRTALNQARQEQVTSQRNFIDIFEDKINQLNPDFKLATVFRTSKNIDHISFNSTNDEVLTYLREEANSALDRTYNILSARIDKFGVTQPNIQLDQQSGRIIVELPGVDDAQRVRKLLKGTAKLEFYETYMLQEFSDYLVSADKALYNVTENEKDTASVTTEPSSILGETKPVTKPSDILGDTSNVAKLKDTTSSALSDLLGADTGANPSDSLANLQKSTPLLSALFPFQVTENMVKSPVVGYVRIGDTAKVNRMLERVEVRENFPDDVKFVWSAKPVSTENDLLQLMALRTTGIEGKPAALGGDVVVDARNDIDPQSNLYVVSMQMNASGAQQWATLTRNNKDKFIAIVLDEQVYSAPIVRNEITGGRSQIDGNFKASEAQDLANILKVGKLPVELTVLDEAVVGPSLGEENISRGMWSLIIGLIAVVLFMAFYYNRSGWVANLALMINLFFIIGVLASLGAALTLPGMAGIVLTLGMAVDANVLIYERIREELRSGKGMRMAVAEGFKNAISAIVDGNITTLLVGIILLTFGSGPIYGFAVTLVIGILTSMFTAILISRLIFEWLLEKEKKINFGNKLTSDVLMNTNYDFIGKRKISYIISAIIISAGIISLVTQGLNYGIDFKGGYSYTVGFEKPVNAEQVRQVLRTSFDNKTPEVKTYGGENKLSITTDYMIDNTDDASDSVVTAKLEQGLASIDNNYTILETQKVGSTIASDIRNSAFQSILFGLIAVFVYIVFRFKRWQFAVGATIALAHDVMVTLAIFSIFKDVLPFSNVDQSIVAALLTIVGFSINDTVVIFDRIREFLGIHKRTPLVTTVNSALNTTLSRTIVTSLTVFIVVAILFLFGGEAVRGFSFALIIGILVGTYSTVFIATPIAIDLIGKTGSNEGTPAEPRRSTPAPAEMHS